MIPHNTQDDYTSCGIIAVNAAVADIFGDKLWDPKWKALEQLTWFLKLHKEDWGMPQSVKCNVTHKSKTIYASLE